MNTPSNTSSLHNVADKRSTQGPDKTFTHHPDSATAMLAKHTVSDWMQAQVITVNPELRIERAWEVMARHGIRHLPVVKHNLLVGIVTERDLKRAVFTEGSASESFRMHALQPMSNPGDYSVEAIMTRCVSVAAPSENLLAVAWRMLQGRVGSLPVVDDNGQVVGILTLCDLVRAMLATSDSQPTKVALATRLSTNPASTKEVSAWDTPLIRCS